MTTILSATLAFFTIAAPYEVLDIAPVWSGHRVGFCLLTAPPRQYAAYYDEERRMTVASRRLDSDDWTYTVLPEAIGWDSHNYITMALDDAGYLHLSGNIHASPLVYFRSGKPYDASTLVRIPKMVGSEEDRTTYPRFFRGPHDEFIFTYRDGGSGNGNQIYNRYEMKTRSWTRLLDTPLVDGEGLRNAYLDGPRKGPDGYFHLAWVWRDTPDCATNHHPSYARSGDLIHWEKSDGTPLPLPITFDTAEVVDPVPPGGGVINGNVRLGFDLEERPVLTYHKYDAAGMTQLYHARRETGGWEIYQASDWEYRWEFGGNGSVDFEIKLSPLQIQDGQLVQTFSHVKYGQQRWRLDPEKLRPVERLPKPESLVPEPLRKVQSRFPGMTLRTTTSQGGPENPGIRYLLRWETLGANRDHARPEPWPEASMLQLITISK